MYFLLMYILRGYYLLSDKGTGLQVLIRLRIYIIMVKMKAVLPFRKKSGNRYLGKKIISFNKLTDEINCRYYGIPNLTFETVQ
jgi:hypothetical protein